MPEWVRRPLRPSHHRATTSLADDDGLRAAYAAHGRELYRFALRGLGDAGAAQDVVQETFLRAWRVADRYDENRASLRVWLFAIARNAIIDRSRAAAVRPWDSDVHSPPTEDLATTAPDPTSRLLDSWLIEEALGCISAEHQEAIVETHLKERPHREVAAELGIPVGTLRSRIFYALKSLRLVMEEMGERP